MPNNCCEDPVIHERITQDIKDWINNKVEQSEDLAGTSESTGCKKKYYSNQSMYDFMYCPMTRKYGIVKQGLTATIHGIISANCKDILTF